MIRYGGDFLLYQFIELPDTLRPPLISRSVEHERNSTIEGRVSPQKALRRDVFAQFRATLKASFFAERISDLGRRVMPAPSACPHFEPATRKSAR